MHVISVKGVAATEYSVKVYVRELLDESFEGI